VFWDAPPHAASGWRIHCGVEVTELNTNKQHSLLVRKALKAVGSSHKLESFYHTRLFEKNRFRKFVSTDLWIERGLKRISLWSIPTRNNKRMDSAKSRASRAKHSALLGIGPRSPVLLQGVISHFTAPAMTRNHRLFPRRGRN
jgi:hypothetical protein